MAVEEEWVAMPVLFVYGSLKQGMSEHHYLQDQHFIGPAHSTQKFTLLQLQFDGAAYPMAIESDDGAQIDGELYEVDPDTLQTIDKYEDYPDLYDRREFDFITDAGRTVHAQMYCGPRREP